MHVHVLIHGCRCLTYTYCTVCTSVALASQGLVPPRLREGKGEGQGSYLAVIYLLIPQEEDGVLLFLVQRRGIGVGESSSSEKVWG